MATAPQLSLPVPPDAARDDRQELALLDAWRHGDSSAMSTLLRGYQARVYAVCFRMLRSADEASDLTQESLVRILEGLHTYDGRSQLSTWIIRVAMNCCLSHLRKQKLRRHASLDDFGQRSGSWASLGAALPAHEDAEPSGVRGVERSEQRIAVVRALARLDAEARAIVVLRDTQGLEYQQIGEVLGIPVGTVKSRLFRARAALRALTEQELGADQLPAAGSSVPAGPTGPIGPIGPGALPGPAGPSGPAGPAGLGGSTGPPSPVPRATPAQSQHSGRSPLGVRPSGAG